MKRIGELIPTPEPTEEPKPLTRKQQQLIAAAAEIRQDQPGRDDKAFMSRQLIQCTLPHRDPGKIPVWTRKNGNLVLGISPGADATTGKLYGYPFGSIPRLLLYWIVTEAKRTKNRRLDLGRNLSDFMRQVGLNPDNGTGRRSDRPRLQDQMERLFQARITFSQIYVAAPAGSADFVKRWLNMDVTSMGELWWDPKRPTQDTLWKSWIELGEKFYLAITESTVPIDTRALKALKQSPMQLDLYGWSAYMAYKANNKQQPQKVYWSGLLEQLGCDYDEKRPDNVKRKIKAAFKKVATVFPSGISHQWSTDGITFLPGTALPVPREEHLELF